MRAFTAAGLHFFTSATLWNTPSALKLSSPAIMYKYAGFMSIEHTRADRVRAGPLPVRLKQELQPELHCSGSACTGDSSEITCAECRPRVAQIHMVQRIERFPPELKILRLGHMEVLHETKV